MTLRVGSLLASPSSGPCHPTSGCEECRRKSREKRMLQSGNCRLQPNSESRNQSGECIFLLRQGVNQPKEFTLSDYRRLEAQDQCVGRVGPLWELRGLVPGLSPWPVDSHLPVHVVISLHASLSPNFPSLLPSHIGSCSKTRGRTQGPGNESTES